jgi:hypothetical protein
MENSFITKYHFSVLYFFYSPKKTDLLAQNSQRGWAQIWLKVSQYLYPSLFFQQGFKAMEVCHLKKFARDSAHYVIHQLDITGAA